MLAYVFWHRPAAGQDAQRYESALRAFHASLVTASLTYRLDPGAAPWLPGDGPAYEDWYLVADWAALGTLNATAVDAEHKAPHDAVAHRSGPGAGTVLKHVDGAQDARATAVRWSAEPPHPGEGAVWQRQLVLGPQPEWCVLTSDGPADRVAL